MTSSPDAMPAASPTHFSKSRFPWKPEGSMGNVRAKAQPGMMNRNRALKCCFRAAYCFSRVVTDAENLAGTPLSKPLYCRPAETSSTPTRYLAGSS